MESVLATYALPFDRQVPVLCMDEQPVQLTKETRTPIAATQRHARRVDYEYERAGTACVFMFTEPKAGWREVRVRQRRTKVDWAHENGPAAAWPPCGCRASRPGVRQPQNAHDGCVLRSIFSDRSPRPGSPGRVPLHTKARQLAEHFGKRTEFTQPAVPRPSPITASPRFNSWAKKRPPGATAATADNAPSTGSSPSTTPAINSKLSTRNSKTDEALATPQIGRAERSHLDLVNGVPMLARSSYSPSRD